MKPLILISILLCAGCETILYGVDQTRPLTAPDGRTGFSLGCNRGMAACYEQARKACGGDYEVIRQDTAAPVRDDQLRTMEVACKKP